MKQIFDWLREQMQEEPKRLRKMKNQCIALSDSEVLAIEEKAYGFYRQCVDEAEAKWKPQHVIKTHLHSHPCSSTVGDCPVCGNGVLPGSKFCRFCGIPLEVE